MLRSLPLVCLIAGSVAGPRGDNLAHPPRGPAARPPRLTPQSSGTSSRLQAISPVSSRIVWASGTGGTWVVTTDGGTTWRAGVVPGAEALEFRDVEGVSDRVAYLLAAGPGDRSRVYKTGDGGESWTLQFTGADSAAFYDCFAFWSPTRGIAMSDAVNGRFPVIRTANGQDWVELGDRMPPAQAGEGAFAASGTCVAVHGDKHAWIATGAAAKARVLATSDGGGSWQAYDTPVVQGSTTSGGISLDFRDARHGILGGGDLAAPTTTSRNIARSVDGGRTWQPVTATPFPGAVYGLSYVPGLGKTVVATGPSGAAWSPDEGDQWFSLPGVENYWAVAFAGPEAGWLVGTDGRILKIEF
jgi:photosystem II stability/assembly factor-like uncharacterized protein